MTSVIRQFFKNVVTTWAGMVIGLVITFFFTPYLISMLGKNRYGIWNLAFSVIAYMGLTDLGMKQSIVRYVSKYLAVRDWKQLNEVISSCTRIYLFVSVVIIGASLVVAFGFMQYFKIPPEYFETARTLMIFLGLTEGIRYMFLPFTSLGAFHRFDITSYFRIGVRVFQTLGIIILLESGYGLVAMALLILVLTVASNFCMWGYRVRKYPEVHFSVKAITREKTKMLLSYGMYSFLIVAAWIAIFQTDNIIIGTFLSMEAVALYSVAAMIVTQIRGSIQIIAVPLVPAISHFEAEKDFKKIMAIYSKSTRYLYYISGFICISILIFGGPFLLLWVKKEFTATISILHILTVAAAIYLPQTIANSILFGISKHKIAFYVLLAEAISKITLSLILVQYMGIVGVALGTAIPQLIIYSLVYPLVFHRAMSVNVGQFYKTAIKSLVYAVIFTLPPAYLLRVLIQPDSWPNFFLDCVIVTVIVIAGMVKFVLEPDDRDRLLGKTRQVMFHKKMTEKSKVTV